MKKLLVLFLLSALMFHCVKDKEPAINEISDIQLIGIEKGGCNAASEKRAPVIIAPTNQIVFSLAGDTLSAFIGIDYICCAIFDSQFKVENDTLLFEMKDICDESSQCYCHCMCYYTFDFEFENLNCESYPYKATVYDARLDSTIILAEGTVDVSSF